MAETVKKASAKPKAPAKASKTAASKEVVNGANGASTNPTVKPAVSDDQVAMLAHQFWIERGNEHGSDADDWFRAEQLLRSKAS